MLETINLYVEKVCFFMIAAQLLFHFLPSKKYEKYMGMITGFLCMAILVVPIGNLVFHGSKWLDMNTIEEFENQLKQVMNAGEIKQAKEQYQSLSKELEEVYLGTEEIKEKIQPIAKEYGFYVKEVSIEEEKIIIFLLEEAKKNGGIEIGKINLDENNSKSVPKELVKTIAKELNIDEEFIQIRE